MQNQNKLHKAFLKDEERAERLQKHNERHGFKRDSPIVNALDQLSLARLVGPL
jgi:hypothetical protein